jgi:hypothetical protein
MKKLIVIQSILILFFFLLSTCSKDPDYNSNNDSPDLSVNDVQNITANAGNGQVVLSWTNPADSKFDHAEITWVPDGNVAQTVANGFQKYTATGLTNDIEYTFTIRTVSNTGKLSAGETICAVPDGTAPYEVTGITAVAVPGYGVWLNWIDPANSDFDHVAISWTPDGSTVQTVAKGTEIAT